MEVIACVALVVIFLTAAGAARSDLTTCGGPVTVLGPGNISSPGFPNEYLPRQHCEWVLRAPGPDQRLSVIFNPHFDLEGHNCRFDYVELRDGDGPSADIIGRYCGMVAPGLLVSSGSALFVRFESDYAHQGAGFSLHYEIHKSVSGSDDCSWNFTAPSGVLSSPGFPDKYSHYLECTYTVWAGPRRDLVLRFTHFHVEGVSRGPPGAGHNPHLAGGVADCPYDRLEVWDGLSNVGPLIGHYCGRRAPWVLRSSTGVLSLRFFTDAAVARDGFSANYTTMPKNLTKGYECFQPLGMESGEIEDEQIMASSSFVSDHWGPELARLYNQYNGWTPSSDLSREWIQVDLRFVRVLSGVATQGVISNATGRPYYVTSYRLEYSTSGDDWTVYRDDKKSKEFVGNQDANSVVLNRLAEVVIARYVRIKPLQWVGGIALRFELYGCQVTDGPCSELLGLTSGLIPDGQLTASSSLDMRWGAASARLLGGRYGWAPANPNAHGQWLQVDLGQPRTVTGVMLQGAKGVLVGHHSPPVGIASHGHGPRDIKAFVRRFRLAHSMDGVTWTHSRTLDGIYKYFVGNANADKPELRQVRPVQARFVRLYPEKWSQTGIGLRLELLGCPASGHVQGVSPVSAAQDPSLHSSPCPDCPTKRPSLGNSSSHTGAKDLRGNGDDDEEQQSPSSITSNPGKVTQSGWVVGRRGAETANPSAFNSATPPPTDPWAAGDDKADDVLQSLDPFLITVITLSTLGVLLGTACAGLLLYCTCSRLGLSIPGMHHHPSLSAVLEAHEMRHARDTAATTGTATTGAATMTHSNVNRVGGGGNPYMEKFISRKDSSLA
ncbi:neuropilin-2-like isoform X1 [Lampetra planeri]